MRCLKLWVANIVMAGMLAACGGGDSSTSPALGVDIEVAAFADTLGPRVGTLTISDTKGIALAKADFYGNSVTQINSASTDLRLVLALPDGVLVPGSSTKGNYLAARANQYVSGTSITLSPLSTLVDAYLTAHPGTAQAVAQAKVLAYLGLPVETALNGISLGLSRTLFDATMFYRAAEAAGGTAALTRLSVAGIDAGQTRSFAAFRVVGSGVGDGPADLAWSIAENLAGEFDKWAGGKIKGWLLQVSGLGSLLDSLGLGDKEDKNAKQLAALTTEINRLGQLIDKLPMALAYRDLLTRLQAAKNFLDEKAGKLQAATTEAPLSADQIKTDFVDPVNNRPIQEELQNTQMGADDPQAPGLISLRVTDHAQYYAGNPQALYDQPLFNLFNQSRALQTQALSLKLEAAHAGDPPQLSLAEDYVDKHYINLKRQKQRYPNALLDQEGVLDRSTGLLWRNHMFNGQGYEAMVKQLSGDKEGWRLPTADEVRAMVPSNAARNGLPADQRNLTPPEIMKHFGFIPEVMDGQQRHFADLGKKGQTYLQSWGPGWVTTAHVYEKIVTEASLRYREVHAEMINLYDGGSSNFVIKYCISSVYHPKDGEVCYRDSKTDAPVAQWAVPLLLVSAPDVPQTLQVYFDKGFNADSGKATAKASLRMGNGIFRDVTKDVIWTVADEGGLVASNEAHVSNGPQNSGEVQYRSKFTTPKKFTVSAEFPWYLADKQGLSGVLKASAALYGNEGVVAAQPLTSLLLSAASKTVHFYPYEYFLSARGVLQSGLPVDQADGITWTSTEPSLVSISSGGRVTVGKAPAKRTEIQITATKSVGSGVVKGVAYLVLTP